MSIGVAVWILTLNETTMFGTCVLSQDTLDILLRVAYRLGFGKIFLIPIKRHYKIGFNAVDICKSFSSLKEPEQAD